MLKKVVILYRNAYAGLPRNAWLLAFADFINRSGFMVLVFLNIYLTGCFCGIRLLAPEVKDGRGLRTLDRIEALRDFCSP